MFPVVVDENGKVEFDFSKIYDTKNGKFPQFAQLSKEIAQDLGFKQTVEVIDLIQNAKGQFTIPANQKKKIFWQKLGNVMQKVGRVVFSIL